MIFMCFYKPRYNFLGNLGKEAAFKAGMDGFIGKPFHIQELIDIILKLTRGITQPPSANSSMPTTADLKFKEMRELEGFQGNHSLYLKVLKSFISDSNKLIKNLPQNIDQDKELAIHTLHTLKGLAGTIGAKKLYELTSDKHQLIKQGCYNKQWISIRNEIIKTTKESIKAARKRIELQENQTSYSSNKHKKATLNHKDLMELIHLLETHNMAAITLFDNITENKQYQGSIIEQMKNAIQNLDFEKASKYCHKLLKSKGASK